MVEYTRTQRAKREAFGECARTMICEANYGQWKTGFFHMKIKRISIYKEFQCIGADCPASCCKGWEVPLDDTAYRKYLSEKGSFGKKLRHSIRRGEYHTTLRSRFGKCPFWGSDHLCSIQKMYGVEYMPQVCVHFPRQLYNLGFFCEETLYLSCPEAVRLFLVHARQGEHFLFEETVGDVAYEVNTTNDDRDFLEYLLTARNQLIEMLDAGCGFDSMSILNYGRDAENACLSSKALPGPFAYKDSDSQHFVADCAMLNQLFFSGFYHPGLKTHLPLLYQLCQSYKKELGNLSKVNVNAANQKLTSLKADLCRKLPELNLILDRYYEYHLQLTFLDIFEDYSFSKHLLFGMAKANMLWVLIALFARDRISVTEAELAEIIALYERRASKIKDGLKGML